ncbi:hypothetical protein KUTeg_013483 [Tegillarca granosa]|uniref:DUF4706 domain-containing protein n=1 Tax=Tegillarca granosa TaxID=220873 RepID=A0ABQ9EU66_TEGGR|nr:hypothetical protein KUTeg_013483 [Tegillarca granosa]
MRFWTWQDEHSAPFSWKSKSQQDLTLLDLEPEQMAKPLSSKNRKGSQGSLGEGVVIDNVAPKEFVYKPGESLWYSTFPAAIKKLNDMPPAPRKVNQTLNQSNPSSGSGGDKSPEEINYAFKDSSHDVRGITNGEISKLNSGDVSNKAITSSVKTEGEPAVPPRKSRNVTKPQVKPPEPPTTKLKQSSSFSKKENSAVETLNKQDILNDNTSVVDPASNAFDNPGLIKDWTQAVEGDSEGYSSSSSSPSRKPLLKEPLSQTMDREGEEKISISQFEHDYSENEDSQSLLNTTERQNEDLNAAYIEHTAVPMKLNVDDGNTTEDFDMKKTGFDFLDNW